MLIRCERCSTVYELDETVLAPEGAPVQCTRCENVFVAYPPRAAGRTLVGVPAVQQAPAEPAPKPPPAPAPPPTGPRAPAADRSHAPAQIYRPTPGPSTAAVRAPVLRKDQVGAFEARLRWSARWKWLAPTLATAAVVIAAGSWYLLANRRDAEADRARAEGLALLALDDAASVDAAVAKIEEAARREPGSVEAIADGALARVLRAEGLREEWEDARSRVPQAPVDENDPRLVRSRTLAAAARAALAGVPPDEADAPAVVRARAMSFAHLRERARVMELVLAARARDEGEPWLDLAEASVDLDGSAEARDRAVVRLSGIAAAHPELLRARWLLARGQASLGRTTEALTAIEAVLSANGRHEGARRLRERLTAPPPPPAPAEGATSPAGAAPAPQEPPPRRRPRVEAEVPTIAPDLSPSPAAELRPLTEEAPPGGVRPDAPPAPAATEEQRPKPAPGEPRPATAPDLPPR